MNTAWAKEKNKKKTGNSHPWKIKNNSNLQECMDKKIKKIQKENKKEGKDLSSLLKTDKKMDKKMDKCERKMKNKK